MALERDSNVIETVVQLLAQQDGLSQMAEVVRILLNEAMKVEGAQAREASPYERSAKRRGYANGFKPKTVDTRLGRRQVAIPQVRGEVEFYPSALERGGRRERALKLAVAEMDGQGVSTRKVTEGMQQLCGLEVSSTQVSRATQLLEEELGAWRERPLGPYRYLFLDARYEKVRHGGTVISCAVRMAIGVNRDGHRSVLGCRVSLSEAEVHWREFLGSLQARGLHGVEWIISDHHAGLRAALASRFAGVAWQGCQFHLQRTAMAFVPRVEMRTEVAADLRAIFDSPDRTEAERRLQLVAEKYQARAPRLSQWLEAHIGEGLTVFAFPRSHRRRLRTSNMVERLSQDIKRRTRVAGLFPNETSLLRLVAAVLMEISEEWETEKIYLRMENDSTAVAA